MGHPHRPHQGNCYEPVRCQGRHDRQSFPVHSEIKTNPIFVSAGAGFLGIRRQPCQNPGRRRFPCSAQESAPSGRHREFSWCAQEFAMLAGAGSRAVRRSQHFPAGCVAGSPTACGSL